MFPRFDGMRLPGIDGTELNVGKAVFVTAPWGKASRSWLVTRHAHYVKLSPVRFFFFFFFCFFFFVDTGQVFKSSLLAWLAAVLCDTEADIISRTRTIADQLDPLHGSHLNSADHDEDVRPS
jgi:hypothetical protein